jgi:hypothetical protein
MVIDYAIIYVVLNNMCPKCFSVTFKTKYAFIQLSNAICTMVTNTSFCAHTSIFNPSTPSYRLLNISTISFIDWHWLNWLSPIATSTSALPSHSRADGLVVRLGDPRVDSGHRFGPGVRGGAVPSNFAQGVACLPLLSLHVHGLGRLFL